MLVKEIKLLRNIIKDWRKHGYSIGLVTTMGFYMKDTKVL